MQIFDRPGVQLGLVPPVTFHQYEPRYFKHHEYKALVAAEGGAEEELLKANPDFASERKIQYNHE